MPQARPAVHSFAIELTEHCNQRCRYCYNEQRSAAEPDSELGAQRRQPSVDPPRVITRLRRLLNAFEIDHVTLTGGEPFAQPYIWDVLDLLREAQLSTHIISNGGLITDEVAARLASYAVRSVQITLNGPDAAAHAEHTGDERHFHGAIAGVHALAQHGIPVVGCIVVTHCNAAQVSEILTLWRSLGVLDIALSRFSPAGQAVAHAAQLLPTRADMIEAFEQALPHARDQGMRLSCTMPIPPCMLETSDYDPIRFGTCSIGTSKQEFALSPDGRLRNCTLHRAAIGDGRDIADPTVDLPQLLRAAEVSRYRQRYPEFCVGCLHAASCAGGCGAAADWMLGAPEQDRRQPDPFLWQHVDDDFAEQLERPIESVSDEPGEGEEEDADEPTNAC